MEKQEIIEKNLADYSRFIGSMKRNQQRTDGLLQYLLDEGLLTSPASTRKDFTYCYPGGLLEHSLRTMVYAAKLRKVYSLENEIDQTSIVTVSLFHDIGKAIDGYYRSLPLSDWRIQRFGQYFEINPLLLYYPVSQLSLMALVQKHGFDLTKEEWNAISSIREQKSNILDESTPRGEPPLTMVLQQAVKASCFQGKNKENPGVVIVTDNNKSSSEA